MKMKPVRAWAGVVDGKLDLPNPATMAFDGYMQVYPTRKLARRFYEGVARVEVREVARKGGRRGK